MILGVGSLSNLGDPPPPTPSSRVDLDSRVDLGSRVDLDSRVDSSNGEMASKRKGPMQRERKRRKTIYLHSQALTKL